MKVEYITALKNPEIIVSFITSDWIIRLFLFVLWVTTLFLLLRKSKLLKTSEFENQKLRGLR